MLTIIIRSILVPCITERRHLLCLHYQYDNLSKPLVIRCFIYDPVQNTECFVFSACMTTIKVNNTAVIDALYDEGSTLYTTLIRVNFLVNSKALHYIYC